MRILLISPYLPHPRIGHGGGTAVRQMVRALARRHEVCLLSLQRPQDPPASEADLGTGVRVETVPFVDSAARGPGARLRLIAGRGLAAARAAWRRQPFYVTKYHHPPLLQRARELVDELDPDVVQIEYLQLADVARALDRQRQGRPRPRLILDSHEHGALPRRRRAARTRGLARRRLMAEAGRWDRAARDASRRVDATLCVTEQDRELLAAAGARGLVTIPLGVDTEGLQPMRAAEPRPRLLFVGSFAHPPNLAAARLLSRELWPALQPQLPGWTLTLAGPGSREFLSAEPSPPAGLEAMGFVDDLTDLFASSRLFVAPLFEGGGIKIKILEAMARGIPLVTTPIGAEGIADRDDDLVAWAETPAAFVEAVLAGVRSPEQADDRARRARRHVEEHFSWDAVVTRLETVYSSSR